MPHPSGLWGVLALPMASEEACNRVNDNPCLDLSCCIRVMAVPSPTLPSSLRLYEEDLSPRKLENLRSQMPG